MRRALVIVLYAVLFLVVASTAQSIWIGLVQRARYLARFPGAEGPLYYVTLATSLAAGLNAILIGARLRWAVWTNIAVGVWSIALIELTRGPRASQIIVAAACAITTILPLILWRRKARA